MTQMPGNRFRFTVRGMMTAVALVALALGLVPTAYRNLRSPPKLMGGCIGGATGDETLDYTWSDLQPYHSLFLVPGLSLIIAMKKPPRLLTRIAISANLAFLIAFAMIRRLCVGPGRLVVWPDEPGEIVLSNWRWSLLEARFWVKTPAEGADLFQLLSFLLLLAIACAWPSLRRLRAIGGIIAIGVGLYVWAALMWSERYLGIGDPPLMRWNIGVPIYLPRPSPGELLQGAVPVASIGYLTMILVRPRRGAIPTEHPR